MKTLCIIPARGGSKGIPRKNLRTVAGKPLVAWSVEVALASKTLGRVIVSTDDNEIAEVARQWGAEVVPRPPEIAGDTASSESALLQVLDYLKQHEKYEPDLVVFLQPTSPHRLTTDVDGAVNHLLQGGYDSVFSACPEHFTGRWSVDRNECALPVNFDPAKRPRRQERQLEYLENGSIYVFRPQILRTQGVRMGGRIGISVMPAERSHQIDSIEDLAFFEKIMVKTAPALSGDVCLMPRTPPVGVLKRIQMLVLDFDGVLTDNRVWVDGEGRETVCCSRSDSWGIARLKEIGVQIAVISTESNSVVEARCRKLAIPCISNSKDKVSALSQLANSMGIDRATIAFVGNDTNDREVLCWVGVPVLVADANAMLNPLAVWVVRQRGGRGAVREICEAIIKAKEVTPIEGDFEGEGIYFVRRVSNLRPDYEVNYWGIIRDPDGVERDRTKERHTYLEDQGAELTFLNSLSGGRLLDVGCGLGYLLSGLDAKWERHGVEISSFAAKHAAKWGEIRNGTLEQATYPAAYFDLVVLYHVIEHMDKPIQILREIRRILRPGGWLVLGTPDFDSGCARLFGARYRLLHDSTHVSLFTNESMHRLLRDEGYVIEKVDYPYFSTRHFTKENLLRMQDAQGISPPFYGNFMTFYVRKPDEGQSLLPLGMLMKQKFVRL